MAVAEPVDPAGGARHLHELRWQAELGRLLVDPVYRGQGVPRGDGGPVMLIPGFLAGDNSLTVMADWLGAWATARTESGIRFNVDCSNRCLLGAGAPARRRSRSAADAPSRWSATAAAVISPRRWRTGAPTSSRASCRWAPGWTTRSRSAPDRGRGRRRAGRPRRTTDRRNRRGCFTTGCGCDFSRHYRGEFPAPHPAHLDLLQGRRRRPLAAPASCPTPAASRSPAATSAWPATARPSRPSPRRSRRWARRRCRDPPVDAPSPGGLSAMSACSPLRIGNACACQSSTASGSTARSPSSPAPPPASAPRSPSASPRPAPTSSSPRAAPTVSKRPPSRSRRSAAAAWP